MTPLTSLELKQGMLEVVSFAPLSCDLQYGPNFFWSDPSRKTLGIHVNMGTAAPFVSSPYHARRVLTSPSPHASDMQYGPCNLI
jgi:hypothetical protein